MSWFQTYSWNSEALLIQISNLAREPENNYGWILKSEDEHSAGTAKEFFGSAASETDNSVKPRLIVEFTGRPPGMSSGFIEVTFPVWLWVLVGVGALLLMVLIAVMIYTIRNRRVTFTYTTVRDYSQLSHEIPDIEQLFNDPSIRVIPLSQIKLGKIIGSGASGAVFSAFLPNVRSFLFNANSIRIDQLP